MSDARAGHAAAGLKEFGLVLFGAALLTALLTGQTTGVVTTTNFVAVGSMIALSTGPSVPTDRATGAIVMT